MNRKEKIEKLIGEGFTTDTLMNFSDKHINSLYERIISEQTTTTTTSNNNKGSVKLNSNTPNIKNVVDKLKTQGINDIEITEKEDENLVVDEKNTTLAEQKKVMKNLVTKLVEEKYTNFTSKESILEMINSKLKK